MKKVNLEFLKDRYYKGTLYKAGEIVEMPHSDTTAYVEFRAGKIVQKKTVKKNTDYDNLSYKEIQTLCKKNGIAAVGKREDMIEALRKFDLGENEQKKEGA
ncbi:MAG: SAP domain-containing protein [Clostridiales bacterium]